MIRILTLLALLFLCQIAAVLAPIRALWAMASGNQARTWAIIKSYDLLGNALTNGRYDEMISSRADRARSEGRRWGCLLCCLLDRISSDHCARSAGK